MTQAAAPTLDPPLVKKPAPDAVPDSESLDAARERKDAFGKVMIVWWSKLPNNGVRIVIPLGVILAASVITGLVVRYARRT